MNLKNLMSTVVVDVKKDVTAVKTLVLKGVSELEVIAEDAADILAGKQPPPTGSKALDDFFKVLIILAPYYPSKEALEAEIADVLTFLQGAASMLN